MLVQLGSVLLQAQPGLGTPGLFLMGGMFVVMYFFMIRPQQKKAKEQKSFADSIAVDENVITIAGIHGRINRINDDGTVQIEVARGTFLTMERSAISMESTIAYRKKKDTAATVTTTTATVTK